MKKSLILFIIGTFLFIIGILFQNKYLGQVYYKDQHNKEPKNWISSIMKNMDQPDSLKKVNLDHINNIVIKGATKYNLLEIYDSKENVLKIYKNAYQYVFDRDIIKDTLFININNSEVHKFLFYLKKDHRPNIILDHSNVNIQFDHSKARIINTPTIQLKNESYALIAQNQENDSLKFNTLNLIADSKSTISLGALTANQLNAKLNNGMIDYDKECHIDSIEVDLIGLSHIRGLKKGGKFKDLKLTGDLSYYNTHPKTKF